MRKLMWFSLGFAGACALGSYFWKVNWALIPGLLGMLLFLVLYRCQNKTVFRKAFVLSFGFFAGIVWFLIYDAVYTQPLRELDGQRVELEFTTYKYSTEAEQGSSVDCYLDLEGKRYRVRLYLDTTEEIEPWTNIEVPVLLRLTTDGGREEPTFHRSNGILALCYQVDTAEFSVRDETTAGLLLIALEDARQWLVDSIEASMPDETADFSRALLLGDRRDIIYELDTAFKISGISHIVAVSGLHMSILFGLIYLGTFKRRWLLAVFGIPAVCLFIALAGFTPSVTRAGIMQILIILALCLNREYDPPTALAFSALVMLVCNPLVASSVGFQLSVSSVAGIFLFYEKLSGWLKLRIPERKGKLAKRLRSWLVSGIAMTGSAQVLTTPLVAYYFGTVSLIGNVTNLAVVWVVACIFYGVMVVCLLGLFSMKLAGFAGVVVSAPVRYVLLAARALSALPMAAVYTESVYIVIWLVLCYGLILGVIFGKDKRPLVAVCVAGLGLCAALALSWTEPLLWEHSVTVLDVGQGQSIILQHGGRTFVVDCGGDYEEDAADKCAEKLLSMGISRIDGLILTHTDADHAGGAAYLLERIEADALYLPEASALSGDTVFFVTEDIVIEADGMKLTLFAPEIQGNGNESSIAVLFQTEKYDTLITGDMSGFWERMLLRRAELPDLELLVVGHHGSKTSTCQELLEAVTPETAVISVGADNSYGHPHQEVLDRLRAAGCEIFRTDQSGDIVYRR